MGGFWHPWGSIWDLFGVKNVIKVTLGNHWFSIRKTIYFVGLGGQVEADGTATFEVPPLYAMRNKVEMRAPVVSGFGRGSRQMGVPTANMDPAVLAAELSGMRRGVYFGFARLPDDTDDGSAWEKCVINVGQRPTFADGDGVTIEVHVLKDFTITIA